MGDPGKYARMQLDGYRLKAGEISELAEAYVALQARCEELGAENRLLNTVISRAHEADHNIVKAYCPTCQPEAWKRTVRAALSRKGGRE